MSSEPTIYVCPRCGREAPSREVCGGSFLDRDHPANVVMVPKEPDRG